MFCTNCGKQIVDTARFCNYCGMKIVNFDENSAQTTPQIADVPAPVTTDSGVFSENVENVVENVENSTPLLNITNEVPSSIPRMNNIPSSGYSPESAPAPDAIITGTPAGPIPPMTPVVETPKPEHRDTLGHLIMCLASTAVMAVVAGIFAGLYFSVV